MHTHVIDMSAYVYVYLSPAGSVSLENSALYVHLDALYTLICITYIILTTKYTLVQTRQFVFVQTLEKLSSVSVVHLKFYMCAFN